MKSANIANKWFSAVVHGDVSTVVQLLHRCKGWYNAGGYTALMLAGVMGNTKLIRILLEHESSLLSKKEDMTALMLVTVHGVVNSVIIIRETEARKQNSQGLTALILACIHGNEEMISLLSRRETGCRTVLGETALMYLVRQNNYQCMHYVIELELKAQMNSGYTALMMAAELNHYECALLLADREACLQNYEGETALMISIRKGHHKIARLLVKSERRYQNAEGWSSLMLSIRYHMPGIAIKLVKDEQGLFSRNNISALMLSIYFDMPEIAEKLLQKEKGISIRSIEETAAAIYHHMKPKNGQISTSQNLRKHGIVDVSITNSRIPISLANMDLLSNKDVANNDDLDAALKPGRTAYMIAVLKRNFAMMDRLHDCESGRQDFEGTTAAMIALEVMYNDLCERIKQIQDGTDTESLYDFARDGIWKSYLQALDKLFPKEACFQNKNGMTLLMLAVEYGVRLAERIRSLKRCIMLVRKLGRDTFFNLLDPNIPQSTVNAVFQTKLGLFEDGMPECLEKNQSHQGEKEMHEYSVSMVESDLTGSCVSVNINVPINILDSDEGSIEQNIRILRQKSRQQAALSRKSVSKSEGTKLIIEMGQVSSSESQQTEKEPSTLNKVETEKEEDSLEIVQSTALKNFTGYMLTSQKSIPMRSPQIRNQEGNEINTWTGTSPKPVQSEDELDSDYLDCTDYYNYEADTDIRIMLRNKILQISTCFIKRYPDELEDLCSLAWSLHINLITEIAKWEAKIHDNQGRTALMLAASHLQHSVVSLLTPLEGALQDDQGNTALMHLILTIHRLSLKIEPVPAPLHHANSLLQGKRGMEAICPKSTYVLYERSTIKQMQKILTRLCPCEKGMQNKLGQTALIFAAANGNFDAVRALLEHEHGYQDNYGVSALMYAIKSRNVNSVLLLVPFEMHLVTWRKDTALMVAARYGILKVCEELLKTETPLVRRQNVDGYTALMLAAANGHVEVVKLLHDYEFTKQDILGQTAAMQAIISGHIECVKLLTEEFDIVDNSGHTIIQIAKNIGRTDIVEFLDLLFD